VEIRATLHLPGGDLAELFDIGARNKRPPAADQDDSLDGVVGLELIDAPCNPFRHPGTECVDRGIVDGDDADCTVGGKGNELCHVPCSFTTRL